MALAEPCVPYYTEAYSSTSVAVTYFGRSDEHQTPSSFLLVGGLGFKVIRLIKKMTYILHAKNSAFIN